MQPRVIELELRVRDVDRSATFYRMLGLPCGEPEDHSGKEERHVHAGWGDWSSDPGASGFFLLNIYPADRTGATRARFGVVVDDVAEVHRRLVEADVEVVRPPEPQPWGTTASYRDPDGNLVSISQRPR